MMTGNQDTNEQKFSTLHEFLEQEHVLVHVNPQEKGVQLPPHLASAPTVTLKLSRLFRGYLEVKKEMVIADLLFDGTYFTCIIPFKALWGCTSQKGQQVIWTESGVQQRQVDADPPTEPQRAKTNPTRGHLRRVK